jgi:anti-sigma regulatory factor (Ser/Thr protein kinase)
MENSNPETKPVRISILLPTNAYFMSGIRDFTMSFIKNATKFSQQWAYRFQSIVDELCNNAIEHGSESGQDIKITIVYAPEESLTITVEDTGTGKTKTKAADIEKIITERRKPGYVFEGIRGRGLSTIVSSWSDSAKFEDLPSGGIKATVTKKLDKSQNTNLPKEQAVSAANRVVLTV